MEGLTRQEVEYRKNNGLSNDEKVKYTRTTKEIVLLPLMVISVTNFFKSSVCFADPKPYSIPSTMITLSSVAKNIQC